MNNDSYSHRSGIVALPSGIRDGSGSKYGYKRSMVGVGKMLHLIPRSVGLPGQGHFGVFWGASPSATI
jgi:hypothetical protein